MINCRMEVLRHGTAENLLLEQIITLGIRCKFHLNVAVLTMAAGLLLMLAFYRNSLANLLAVRNDRVGQRNLYAKLILQLGAQNVQMNIAGTGDQVLLGFRVKLGIEGRILITQTSKAGGDLLLNALYLRRDCLRVARRRNLDRLNAKPRCSL